jgi:hypothetical protein
MKTRRIAALTALALALAATAQARDTGYFGSGHEPPAAKAS